MKKPREPSQIAECQNGSEGKLSEKNLGIKEENFPLSETAQSDVLSV